MCGNWEPGTSRSSGGRALAAALAWVVMGGPAAGADDAQWKAPAEERTRTNPLSPSPPALLKGRALFQRHCASCHGAKGKGDGPEARFGPKLPQDLTDSALQERITDGEAFWKITQGRRENADVVMPGFGREMPSDEDRWKVVLFFRSLKVEQAGR